MYNIRHGRPDATDEQCIEAAKLADAHDFIERLPGGYDFVLEDGGSNLSQGRIQEMRPHDELIQKKGFYFDLYLKQFKRELLEEQLAAADEEDGGSS